MTWLAETLQRHPELAVFLTLAIGQALARIRVGSVRLNGVVAVLLAGVAVGQLRIDVPAPLQWAFFALFLFSIGYQTGPQFFRGLGRSALPQVGLSLLLCGAVLASTLLLARLFGFNAGAGAGLLAGGLNASAAIGTAGDAIAGLPLQPPAIAALSASLTVAFAVTYLVGLVTEIVTLTVVGPWLMRVDLASECRALEQAMGAPGADDSLAGTHPGIVLRAYVVPERLDGSTVAAIEESFSPARVFAERLRTPEGLATPAPETIVRAGSVVALSGRHASHVDPANPLAGHEVDDPELLDIPAATVEVAVASKAVVGRTLGELAVQVGPGVSSRGVFARQVRRGLEELPVGTRTVVERGDVLALVGAPAQVARIAALVGRVLPPASSTDLLAVASAIALGGLVGVLTVRLAGLDIGLSMPVGILLGGLLVGWLNSLRPALARVPGAVLRVFDTIGLAGFLAIVGINAGPEFLAGLASSGGPLLLAGVLVCLLPNVVTILVGRYLLHIHPGILLGICAGAGTSPAGLAAVQEKAGSRVPTLGYGVSYAVGNLLLALWGSVVVTMLRR